MISKYRFISMWILAVIIMLGIGMCKVVKAADYTENWKPKQSMKKLTKGKLCDGYVYFKSIKWYRYGSGCAVMCEYENKTCKNITRLEVDVIAKDTNGNVIDVDTNIHVIDTTTNNLKNLGKAYKKARFPDTNYNEIRQLDWRIRVLTH